MREAQDLKIEKRNLVGIGPTWVRIPPPALA